jgi:alpha-D-ribose 1-methylphosphonate 5-triphosphate synthase subunit PhnH
MVALRESVTAGFADASGDSQLVFRAVLKAMSRPGLHVPCPTDVQAPKPLAAPTAAVALCLLDNDTPIWLDAAFDTDAIRAFLGFHVAAPRGRPPDAAFALIGDARRMPKLDDFDPGSALRPERSATLIVQLRSLGTGEPVAIAGPGIESTATVRFDGLADWFWPAWDENHRRFPLGVDLILTDGREISALPRSIRRA